MLSIVIPALNDRDHLARALEALTADDAGTEIVATGGGTEIIVADGGSIDGTADAARALGARVVTTAAGRGTQLAAGARESLGDWLLFLHADTRPGPGWRTVVNRFMAEPANRFRAGYFAFALDDGAPEARRLEKIVAWRCRTFALPYGDQGLLIGREFYDTLGGFKDMVLMEDVELVRRISRHRLEPLPAIAVTSAERYRRDGYLLRSVRNLSCLALYFLGVPPNSLVGFYR